MTNWPPPEAVCEPLFFNADACQAATRARQLEIAPCAKSAAVRLTRLWHSRLPNTQDGPWMAAYWATFDGAVYAVALWNTPSARTLPQDWLELRRMACAPYAPFNTASRFLGAMTGRPNGRPRPAIATGPGSVRVPPAPTAGTSTVPTSPQRRRCGGR